jgi:photosystem II stability/assembly factor-like uncharacterized protein
MWVATRKGLFAYERNGAGWRVANRSFLGDNVSMVLPDERDGAVYAALDHGHFGVKLHRSRDGGGTWTEIAVPAYPAMPEGAKPEVDAMGREIPWTLKLIWALEHAGKDRPGHLWCGTVPGGLFYSKDGGDSWELVRSLWDDPKRKEWMGGGMNLPGIHSICVRPGDSDRVQIGISCGGVWETRDGGRTWGCGGMGMRAEYMPPEKAFEMNAQDPHRLVVCPARPDVAWVQHHNGIFHSTDGCKSWGEIKDVHPSVFGFAVVAHPTDPETAWFVPAIKDERRIPVDGKLRVTRTRDGGKTFTSLTRGLPQEDAYDIVYRHCLDVTSAGDALAFGTTTGSLFVSEDQGDSWQALSNHLPPVYAVRFEQRA